MHIHPNPDWERIPSIAGESGLTRGTTGIITLTDHNLTATLDSVMSFLVELGLPVTYKADLDRISKRLLALAADDVGAWADAQCAALRAVYDGVAQLQISVHNFNAKYLSPIATLCGVEMTRVAFDGWFGTDSLPRTSAWISKVVAAIAQGNDRALGCTSPVCLSKKSEWTRADHDRLLFFALTDLIVSLRDTVCDASLKQSGKIGIAVRNTIPETLALDAKRLYTLAAYFFAKVLSDTIIQSFSRHYGALFGGNDCPPLSRIIIGVVLNNPPDPTHTPRRTVNSLFDAAFTMELDNKRFSTLKDVLHDKSEEQLLAFKALVEDDITAGSDLYTRVCDLHKEFWYDIIRDDGYIRNIPPNLLPLAAGITRCCKWARKVMVINARVHQKRYARAVDAAVLGNAVSVQ